MAQNFELELDAFKATIVMTCPVCGRKNKETAARIKPGTKIECRNGDFTWEFTGDDLSSIQQDLDDIKRALRGFGNGF